MYSIPKPCIWKVCLEVLLSCGFIYAFIFGFKFRNKQEMPSSPFKPQITDNDIDDLLRTLERFDKLMTENNITYILEGGTLIGSFRHHGPIPWDDDVDVLVNASDRDRLAEILPKMKPDFDFFTPVNYAWKFYDARSKHLPYKPFRWPYVDIFFWNNNETHMYHEIYVRRPQFTAPIYKILPPVRRKFAHLSLPVPCNLNSGLHAVDLDICESPTYSHKAEKYIPLNQYASVPCSELGQKYGFVKHVQTSDGRWNESMIFREMVLYSIITPKYC
ncbi:uncharacterized protein RP688-like [Ylistrum balloti]|uniref:uncharacterized protein RP688-like n=1 Tax=Ylistrum balloti TaxID=509963 RepID=UPI002905D6D2|nr:uncharacterized protein RP688-like [Ylistrum balloti]